MDGDIVERHDVIAGASVLPGGVIVGIIGHGPCGSQTIQGCQGRIKGGIRNQSEPGAAGLVKHVQSPFLGRKIGCHPEIVGIVSIDKPVISLAGGKGEGAARGIIGLH